MKMTSLQMKKKLDERLSKPEFNTSYNRDKDTYRIEWKDSKQGMTIALPNVVSKYNNRGEAAINELEDHVTEALRIMNEEHNLTGMEKNIYPVIRATSFATETNAGTKLVFKEHTAETRVYYALDLGKSYRLIDEPMLEKEGWTYERIDEIATFNIRSLSNDFKKDTVADNDFYFVAKQDGYDASKILNEAFLEEMLANSKGQLIGRAHV